MTEVLIFCMIHAFSASEDDAAAIRANEKIDHVRQWLIRSMIACAVCGIAGAMFGWSIAGFFLGVIAYSMVFSAMFRYKLNKLRGLKFDYMSLSNTYDSVFFLLFGNYAGVAAYITEMAVAIAAMVAFPFT